MEKLSDKIAKKIKEEKIEPKPKWQFLLKDYSIWIIFAASILIGSLAFSVILFMLTDNDWDVYRKLDKSFGEYLLLTLPYFWIVFLAAFAWISFYAWKHTKKGYKINPAIIVAFSIFASLILGSALFAQGLGSKLDYVFSDNLRYYDKLHPLRAQVLSNPEKGFLSGVIIKYNDENNFQILDIEKKSWEITGDSIVWKGKMAKNVGAKVKIVGKIEESNKFIAEQVVPLRGARMKPFDKPQFREKMKEKFGPMREGDVKGLELRKRLQGKEKNGF